DLRLFPVRHYSSRTRSPLGPSMRPMVTDLSFRHTRHTPATRRFRSRGLNHQGLRAQSRVCNRYMDRARRVRLAADPDSSDASRPGKVERALADEDPGAINRDGHDSLDIGTRSAVAVDGSERDAGCI